MSMPEANMNPAVDLVIVIDTSASMKDEATGLSQVAEAAIEATRSHCPCDLRVSWFGLEGTWRGTHFTQTLRHYLTEACQVAETDMRGRKRGTVAGGGAQEDGARTVEDVARHFDWRPEAKRAMFWLGDEALEGGGDRVTQEDIEAANRAIAAAQEATMAVHTYMGTSRSRHWDAIAQEYARVSQEAGGQSFTAQHAAGGFTTVLEEVICTVRNQPKIPSTATLPGGGAEKDRLLPPADLKADQPTLVTTAKVLSITDYLVLQDTEVKLTAGETQAFPCTLPASVDLDNPAILAYKLMHSPLNLHTSIEINGQSERHAHWCHDTYQTLHEVIGAGKLVAGANTVTIAVEQEGQGSLSIADVVLWFQRKERLVIETPVALDGGA